MLVHQGKHALWHNATTRCALSSFTHFCTMNIDLNSVQTSLEPLLNWGNVPLNMPSLMALAAGLGWASGFRLYALIFTLGALDRFAGVTLPGDLNVLSNYWVLGISGVLLLTEFLADKIPWLDSVWDSIHTFIRIPAGAALAAGVMGDQGAAVQLATALLGGTLAAGRWRRVRIWPRRVRARPSIPRPSRLAMLPPRWARMPCSPVVCGRCSITHYSF